MSAFSSSLTSPVSYVITHTLTSDTPTPTDIDIQQCVYDAVRVYQQTPPSAFVRMHDPTPTQSDIPPEAVSITHTHLH